MPAPFLARMMKGIVQRTTASAHSTVKSTGKNVTGGLEIASLLLELAGLGFDIYHTVTIPQEIDSIKSSLDQIQSEVYTLNQNINALANHLNIDFTDLNNQMMQQQLQGYLTDIQDDFGEWSDNRGNPQYFIGFPYSLYYFTYQVQQGTFRPPLCDNPNSTACSNLKKFYDHLTDDPIDITIDDIYNMINPDATDLQPYLMAFASTCLLRTRPPKIRPQYTKFWRIPSASS